MRKANKLFDLILAIAQTLSTWFTRNNMRFPIRAKYDQNSCSNTIAYKVMYTFCLKITYKNCKTFKTHGNRYKTLLYVFYSEKNIEL